MMILVYMYWVRLKITYFIFKILFYWRHLKIHYSEDPIFQNLSLTIFLMGGQIRISIFIYVRPHVL